MFTILNKFNITMFLLSGTECSYTALGKEYRGLKNTTVNNTPCKPWGGYRGGKFAGENYCRNDDNTPGGPWCYIVQISPSAPYYEDCGIPLCSE